MGWVAKRGSKIRYERAGAGNTKLVSLDRIGSELCSGVQERAGKTALLLDGSGSEKLGGTLKDAARVKPWRNREPHK
jgi:hypothetical protein